MKFRSRISWFWAVWGFGFAALNGAFALFGNDDWWWVNAIAGAICLVSGAVSLFELPFGKSTRKATEPVATNSFYTSGGFVTSTLNSSEMQKALNRSIQGLQYRTATTSTAPAVTSGPGKPEPFHGLPFDLAVGEVYGLRMWHMDKYGRLRARNWEGAPPWRPGVNEAKCVKRSTSDGYHFGGGLSFGMDYKYEVRNEPDHDVPSEKCTCGFYAYTDNLHAEVKSHAKNGEEPVLGIIKGTGRTLIGTQGFRCEKAEIVAFRDPTRGGIKSDPWRTRQLAHLRRVYPDIPILGNRSALLEFAPLTETMPEPNTDEFWALP